MVTPVLTSKYEELRMLGFKEVTIQDIWDSLIARKWRKPKAETRLYEIVADILSLSGSDYMTCKTLEAYRTPLEFQEISEEELRELFK